MADFKILQNIDLAQNEIKEVSKISNIREDEKSKGLTIQTENKSILITSGKTNASKSTYTENSIVSKADTIKFESQGYTDKDTNGFPHIKLTSDTNNKSLLVEGKTINISSQGGGDTINLSGSKLNVGSTTTEITSSTINIGEGGKILDINASSKVVTLPPNTTVDIKSKIIGIGDTNSTTTINGSELKVKTTNTNIDGTSTLSGTTTLQSSKPTSEESTPKNTLKVDTTSISITGEQVAINPKTVNIGTATTKEITIGRTAEDTTTLKSKKTKITSPTLNVTSPTVKFGENTNQTVSFNGSGSVTSNVNTSVVDKTFSVKNGSTDILKADTTSVSLAGDSTSITSKNVAIGTDTTTGITIGRNASGTTTSLTSETTSITSPILNVGQTGTSTLNIGNDSADVTFAGNNNLSITSDTTTSTSTVKAKNLNFTENLVGNGIKIYWDTNLSSLVFAKE